MRNNAGYILLSRSLIESAIWDKPPLYIKVWLYLLIKAQFRDYKNLKRGQVITSIAEIQEECSWYVGYRIEKPTKDQVYQVIDWMRRKGDEAVSERDTNPTMITTSKATTGLRVTIENYCFYQDFLSYGSNSEGNNEADTKATREQRQPDTKKKAIKHVKQKNRKKEGSCDATNSSSIGKWEQFVIR